MNPLLRILTWPFRAASEFVDERPSGGQIRDHLRSTNLVTIEQDGNLSVVEIGPGRWKRDIVQVPLDNTLHDEVLGAYCDGVDRGLKIARQVDATLTRKVIKAAKRTAGESAKAARKKSNTVGSTLNEVAV